MSRGSDFWSRRKAQVEAEADAEATAAEAAELALHEAKLAERSDEDLLEELGLPDPDSLQPGDDFKAFMAKAVPDRLRRRALRRLWLSNPALANLDGLLDYGEDFTDSAKVIENMQTAYQVGKGMKAHVDEMIRQVELEANPPEEADPLPEQDETDEALTLADEAGQVPALDIAEVDEVEDENEDLYTTAPRRRMHFEFEDQAGGPA
ncbi:hypothetical protein PEL8287_02002 [Roseovarius litorisediminis]|uniref:DUF3306 domain-containing protein n=1 Tax=Roseovarius litorisediminis TaxID=1312363 RepID=A0A1Y5SHZ3_9RHOB|nr:DUF3306 domain-containing protein [Roseovarius litorisediminis]SLN40552.1 hypothetical protein PEL8287_02002 [Roseovarius litorisediminis]